MNAASLLCSLALFPLAGGALPGDADANWPQFRGPDARGVADGYDLPETWNYEEWEGIAWDCPIPGLSHASPVIWKDLIFVVSAVREGDAELKVGLYGSIDPVPDEGVHQFNLYCIDKVDGGIIWEETAVEAVPKIKRHPKGSHAASSPVTDGERVIAFFASEGLYCYSVDGEPLWSQDLGVMDSGYYLSKDAQWGFSSSPVIHGDRVLMQCDIQEGSFLTALSLEDGSELWRVSRDDVPTWGCPTVHVGDQRQQVICNGFRHIGGYDLATGAELWKLVGGGDIPVPTPVVAHDLIYITNSHGSMAPIFAIQVGASGELQRSDEEPQMAWWIRNRGNYMQTPLVYGDLLYLCSDAGVVGCYDARTGEEHYRERLGRGQTGFTASGVAGDGKLYFTSEEGEIHVLQAGPDFEKLGVNDMGEPCMATPALSAGGLYVRSRSRLVAVRG